MRKEDCAFNLTWDYRGLNPNNSMFYTQNDWNQTLITKINQVSAQIHQSTMVGSANKIISHPLNRHIFTSMEFYHEDNSTLSGRFLVVFDEECEMDTIYVYNDKIENPRHVYLKTIMDATGMGEVRVTLIPEEIQEIKRKYCSYITILNNNVLKFGI